MAVSWRRGRRRRLRSCLTERNIRGNIWSGEVEWRPKERISNGLSKISPSLPLTACECALCSEREEERRKKKERGKESGEIWFSHGGNWHVTRSRKRPAGIGHGMHESRKTKCHFVRGANIFKLKSPPINTHFLW